MVALRGGKEHLEGFGIAAGGSQDEPQLVAGLGVVRLRLQALASGSFVRLRRQGAQIHQRLQALHFLAQRARGGQVFEQLAGFGFLAKGDQRAGQTHLRQFVSLVQLQRLPILLFRSGRIARFQ